MPKRSDSAEKINYPDAAAFARKFTFSCDQKSLRIAFIDEKTVHVTYYREGEEPHPLTLTGLRGEHDDMPDIPLVEDDSGEYAAIDTGSVRLKVNESTLDVTYFAHDAQLSGEREKSLSEYDVYRSSGGKTKIRETADGIRSSSVGGDTVFVRKSNHAKMTVDFDESETLFGLGSHEEGFPSLRGHFIPLYQENMRIAIPVFVSTKGYAYVFNCASLMTFDARPRSSAEIYFDSVDAIDYYFIAGDDFDDVCRKLRLLWGETPLLPKWAFGYIQSKERYRSADELLAVADEYRRRKIPLDCIVQDWMYWRDGMWGDKHFDPARYPDPKKLTDALHERNVRLMISIWPNMTGDSADRREFEEAGLLLGDGSVYDAFSETGRALYAKQAFDGLFSFGIDGWWCDSTEPYDTVWRGEKRLPPDESMALSVGEFKKYIDDSVINAYSLMHSKGIYEEQRRRTDKKRVINLTRSAFIGQHKYGTVVWSGDVSASWETLRRQVSIIQNYSSCGLAYWNSDIGAFFVRCRREWYRAGEYEDGASDNGYRELYTRWMQFAVFTPMFRSHGTDTPREIWNFGEPGTTFYDAIETAIRQRYSLLPYIYSLSASVTFKGEMMVRPLALAFPSDKMSHEHTEEYIFGHELLVCPVTKPIMNNDKSAEIYLPPCGWYDLYTNEYYEGGRTFTVKLSIDRIPVFVRAGSVIPFSAVTQSTSTPPEEPYDVVICRGDDGEFTLYEDSGDGYGYESGDFAMTRIIYDDMSGELTEKITGIAAYKHELKYRFVGEQSARNKQNMA